MAGFSDILDSIRHKGGLGIAKTPISAHNVAIRVQSHANVSKQTTLLDSVDVGPPKWRVCGRSLNWSVHEGMKDISNVKVHLKTCSVNVNI